MIIGGEVGLDPIIIESSPDGKFADAEHGSPYNLYYLIDMPSPPFISPVELGFTLQTKSQTCKDPSWRAIAGTGQVEGPECLYPLLAKSFRLSLPGREQRPRAAVNARDSCLPSIPRSRTHVHRFRGRRCHLRSRLHGLDHDMERRRGVGNSVYILT